jgi:hypothetical protein
MSKWALDLNFYSVCSRCARGCGSGEIVATAAHPFAAFRVDNWSFACYPYGKSHGAGTTDSFLFRHGGGTVARYHPVNSRHTSDD